jgi:hypothetical protein
VYTQFFSFQNKYKKHIQEKKSFSFHNIVSHQIKENVELRRNCCLETCFKTTAFYRKFEVSFCNNSPHSSTFYKDSRNKFLFYQDKKQIECS